MIELTRHAIDRALERIPGLQGEEDARRLLLAPAVQCAGRIGAKYVRLASGHRLVIEDNKVVTVLPPETPVWKLGRSGDHMRRHARGWAEFYRGEQ